MITVREVSHGLFGAWRLAHLDPSGMRFFDATITGFWRSFWAAAIVAPVYIVMIGVRLSAREEIADPVRIVLIEVIAYIIAWTAFPVVAWQIVLVLGRAGRYIAYIVAFNWGNVLQVAALIPVMLIGATGILPDVLTQILGFAVLLALLFYHYFIARTALGIDAIPAIGLVLMDLLLTILRERAALALEAG